jgi:hypothetical protein
MKDTRKGKLITIKLGEDKKRLIPRVFDTIYRMVKTPVSDDDNPDDDETFVLNTLQTVEVEGVTIIDSGRAVNVNGEFEISLEDDAKNEVWADKDEAIAEWEYRTNLQLKRAEELQKKVDHIVNALRTSKEEKQY